MSRQTLSVDGLIRKYGKEVIDEAMREPLSVAENAIIRRRTQKHKDCWGTGRVGYDRKMTPIPCPCFREVYAEIVFGRILCPVEETANAG